MEWTYFVSKMVIVVEVSKYLMKNNKNKPIKLALIYNIISLTIFIMALAGWEEGDFWDKINDFLGTSILQKISVLIGFFYRIFLFTPVGISFVFIPFNIFFSIYFGTLVMKYAPKINDWFYIIKNIFLYMCIVYINALLSKLALDWWKFNGLKMLYDSYVLLQMKVNGIAMLIGIVVRYIWRRLSD